MMTGQELYNKYVSLRDFTGSKEDEYGQLLQTILFSVGEKDMYPLLEEAEKKSKRLSLSDFTIDRITTSGIIMI